MFGLGRAKTVLRSKTVEKMAVFILNGLGLLSRFVFVKLCACEEDFV